MKLLERLKTRKVGAGETWEIAVACALVLRTELLSSSIVPASLSDSHLVKKTSDPTSKLSILPECLIDCIKSNGTFTSSLAYPQSDLDEVLSDLKSDKKPRSQPEARLVYPVKSGFRTYDLFLVFYDIDGSCEIFGYQCKKGKGMDLGAPDPRVDRSFLVRGDAAENPRTDTPAATAGWIAVTESECIEFMGPTLWPVLKFEDALPSGKDAQASEPSSDD